MNKVPSRSNWYLNDIIHEKELDENIEKELSEYETRIKTNISHIIKGVNFLANQEAILAKQQQKERQEQGEEEEGYRNSSEDNEVNANPTKDNVNDTSLSKNRGRGGGGGVRFQDFLKKEEEEEDVSDPSARGVELVPTSSPFLQYVTDLNDNNNDEDEESALPSSSSSLSSSLRNSSSTQITRKSLSSWNKTQEILQSKKVGTGS
mmetsp:Transcript_2003/g.2671  ORF Transcript_2003/g.2671 Transcript_2003/m.2671 type:complete len:206 (-) Transcript_2003:138-755(-)